MGWCIPAECFVCVVKRPDIANHMYEVLTSVDAGKSFSAYKQILGSKGMTYE